ncbi:MAG: hypothetical protein WCJ35_17325 [Planctomycetota bacterium]
MSDNHAKPSELPANLMALQLQLADLATRTKQVVSKPQERSQATQGPVLVIRGK